MTQSDKPSEPQMTPLTALKKWADDHLSEPSIEPDAEDVLEFEEGDDVTWPEGKLFGQVLTGGVCLCSGDDIVLQLDPGDLFPTLPADSKFRLLANGQPTSKCRWLDQDALGEVTVELTQLELAYWRDISESLAIETSQPQTAVSVHEPGELLIREGDQSTCIFEMIGGEAEVVVGGNIVGQIHSGEFFGEFTFLVEAPRSATVRATTHCTVQEISADEFERLIKSRPQIILDIAKDLAKRLQSTNQKVDNPKPAPRAKSQAGGGRYRLRVRT